MPEMTSISYVAMNCDQDRAIMVYCTFPSREIALTLCKSLVTGNLIACANIQSEHTSIYRWQKEVVEEREVSAWLKTTTKKWAALKEKVQAEHPYQNPCLLAVDVAGGLPEFLTWVSTETV